jgi:hypothetical protein
MSARIGQFECQTKGSRCRWGSKASIRAQRTASITLHDEGLDEEVVNTLGARRFHHLIWANQHLNRPEPTPTRSEGAIS